MTIVLAITILFGVLRFIVPVEGKINRKDIFKDMAHLWVGGLIGAAMVSGDTCCAGLSPYAWMAIGITVVEVVAFIVRKSH